MSGRHNWREARDGRDEYSVNDWAAALYVYDGDPVGARFAVEALNNAYVRLVVESEDGTTASVLVTPESLYKASQAAVWP